MNMTAPPLKLPFEPPIDPTAISRVPIAIIAKAIESNHAPIEDTGAARCDEGGVGSARQLEQDNRAVSKQSPQIARPQD